MFHHRYLYGLLILVAMFAGTPTLLFRTAKPVQSAEGLPISDTSSKSSKVSGSLLELARLQPQLRAAQHPAMSNVIVDDEWVVVDATAAGDTQALRSELEALGLRRATVYGRLVSGQLPISAIPQLDTLPSLNFVRPAFAITSVGVVDSQGDAALRADDVRTIFGVDGTGITVGVLSDTYDCLGGAGADVTSGDLPAGVNVLADTTYNDCLDEGRAMMQLISDVAPGAALSFHTAWLGQADFAQGIRDLANAGATVIVDDIFYYAEPFFQDGPIAQAVDAVSGQGVAYFSAAGNSGRNSYESAFTPSGTALPGVSGVDAHDFDPGLGVDIYQGVVIPTNGRITVSFQWDQPFFTVSGAPGATTNMDIYLFNDPPTTILASSTDNNVGNDPLEVLTFNNNGTATNFNIAIVNANVGPNPGLMKYIHFGAMTISEYNTASRTVVGHANTEGALAVGAADFQDTPEFGTDPAILEGFSSAGSTPILFDLSGNAVSVMRNKPDIVAPDGTDTTFFGTDTADAGTFPNFFGTSAAAPHAAAVAALMQAMDNTLAPAAIYTALENTADDMNTPGFDFDSGFGLIQADRAVGSLTTADLSIIKTGEPDPAIAGEELLYNLTVRNNGPDPALAVRVTDAMPSGVTYNADSAGCSTSTMPTLICDLGTLAVGEERTFTIRVTIAPDLVAKAGAAVTIENTASVTAVAQDANNVNNTATWATRVVSKADLRINAVAHPSPSIAGEQLFYDVAVVNLGPDLALDVVITDTLPSGLSFVTSTGSCSVSSASVVMCQLGNLPVGQERSLTIKTMVDPGFVASAGGPTALTNTFVVGATSIDPQVENNRATPTTIVEELSDLRTTNDCKPDQPVAAGKEATCTMTVENLGPSTARNVDMISTLLSDGTFRAGAVTPATCVVAASAPDRSSTVSCAMGHLAKGERFMVVVPIIGDEAQDISNHLVVSSDTPEREPSNNQATDSVSVRAWADLSIAFTVNTTRAVVNTPMTLELEVTNQGPSTAHDVVVTQLLPAGITFEQGVVVASAGRCYMEPNATDNTIHCELGTLTSGATARIVVTGTPTSEAVRKTLVTVTAQEDDPNPVNNLDEAEVNSFKYYQYLPAIQGDGAGTQADLVGSFTVSPNRQEFTAGEPVTITVTVTNQGTAAAAPFMVDFYINPSVVPASANVLWSRVCGMNPCLGIAWQVERSLAPGESIMLTSTDESFAAKFTAWPGWFAQGATDLYLYVDSYGLSSPSGAVVESNEENNQSELHGLLVTGVNPASVQSNDLPLLRAVE